MPTTQEASLRGVSQTALFYYEINAMEQCQIFKNFLGLLSKGVQPYQLM
jgi:hypothetical protein